jgi:soluble lytic murein transglycosylase
MKSPARLALLLMLIFSGLACNMQRVLDPSLPTFTSQSNPTSTQAPTQAPTPAATLSNEARVTNADQLFFYGDWDDALSVYKDTLGASDDDGLRAAALLGMGRTYLKLNQLPAAEESLTTLLGLYPNSEQVAEAQFALAQLYDAQNDPAKAADAYQSYMDARQGLIDSYVEEWRGDALFAAGNNDGALAAYQLAIAAPRLGDSFGLQVKVGDVYAVEQNYESAILTYQTVYNTTTNDYLKADMDLKMGRAYVTLGNSAQAYELYQDAVSNFPLAYSSYAALVDLVTAEVPVDEFQRGLVDYSAAASTQSPVCEVSSQDAQELYLVAIAAFDRFLEANPDNHLDAAHYYRGLALRASGDYGGAIAEFNHMQDEHGFDIHWVDSFSEKAMAQWLCQEDYDGAIQTLLDFVAATPSQPAAAEFLFTAGRIAEDGGRLTRASEIWPRVANEYPASEYAYDALFRAGICLFRLKDYVGAQSLFVRANQAALGLEQESQSQFWVAKSLQAQGNADGAKSTWQQVASLDPTGYYSERAADLLAGRAPFQPPRSYSLDYDVVAKRSEAEDWIRSTFNLPADTDLSNAAPLQSDARFVRGTELWHLGEYEMARAEFESLRMDLTSDPANSYRLANYLIELGLYRTGIFAAREVLTMAGMSDADTMNAPTYFNRLRFGAYYWDLVTSEAASESIDPLFIYSMMRQESLFEGFVTSSAGARGLLQIIPTTGEEQATLSGWPPDFTADDLYRPMVSIRLGVDYLARQVDLFDGDKASALAAYNGGPSSVQYWQSLANGDPDLFLEVIQTAETSDYIRHIYELFNIYRNLYSTVSK